MGQHSEPDYRFTTLAVGGAVIAFNVGGLAWSQSWWALAATVASVAALVGWIVFEYYDDLYGLRGRRRKRGTPSGPRSEPGAQRQAQGPDGQEMTPEGKPGPRGTGRI